MTPIDPRPAHPDDGLDPVREALDDDPDSVGLEPFDDRDVQRYLRALTRERAELARLCALAAAERERIDAWLADAAGPVRRRIDRLIEIVTGYHRVALERDPRAKTLRFPAGTLTSRAGAERFVIDDKDAFLAWARERRPDLLRVFQEPDKAAVNKALTVSNRGARTRDGQLGYVAGDDITGDYVPGVVAFEAERRFSVTTETGTETGGEAGA